MSRWGHSTQTIRLALAVHQTLSLYNHSRYNNWCQCKLCGRGRRRGRL